MRFLRSMIHSKFNGQIVTLPYARSGLVFYYNADLLKEAGLQPPKTVKEMEKVAKALTKVENGKTVRYGVMVESFAAGKDTNVHELMQVVTRTVSDTSPIFPDFVDILLLLLNCNAD